MYIIACVGLAVMVFSVGYEVISRRLFGHPTSWSFEISAILLLVITLLAASHIHRKDLHIRMDFLRQRLSRKALAWRQLVESILGVSYCALIVWKGLEFAVRGFHYHSSSILALPLFPFLILIPISFLFWGLQFLVKIGEAIRGIRGHA